MSTQKIKYCKKFIFKEFLSHFTCQIIKQVTFNVYEPDIKVKAHKENLTLQKHI